MKLVELLELDDTVQPDDYCRPLRFLQESWSDEIHTESTYGGSPINNLKWVRFDAVFGECWFGKTVREITNTKNGYEFPYEFVRGEIPEDNILKCEAL